VKVTEVKLSLRDQEMVRAYVDIVLDDSLVIRDLRTIHDSRGYFVAMPSKPLRDGRRADFAHPITLEARRMIEDAVLAEYRKVFGEAE
jgi:DNA-binding cell septation regulator SpoVG